MGEHMQTFQYVPRPMALSTSTCLRSSAREDIYLCANASPTKTFCSSKQNLELATAHRPIRGLFSLFESSGPNWAEL